MYRKVNGSNNITILFHSTQNTTEIKYWVEQQDHVGILHVDRILNKDQVIAKVHEVVKDRYEAIQHNIL